MLANVVLLIKLKGSPICPQTGLERSLFVGKLQLSTPPTIFVTFTPVYLVDIVKKLKFIFCGFLVHLHNNFFKSALGKSLEYCVLLMTAKFL